MRGVPTTEASSLQITRTSFELKYGADYQAVLTYRTVYKGVEVEYWIRNLTLDIADSRCRFVIHRHRGRWMTKDEN